MHSVLTIGRHRITNESIESPAVDAMLETLGGRKINVYYSDPPWGDGNLKYWVALNKKMTGRTFAPLTYEQLIARIMAVTHRHVHGHLFIETGPRWSDMLLQRFQQEGLHNCRQVQTRYRAGSKLLRCDIVYGGTSSEFHMGSRDYTQLRGAPLARAVVEDVATPGGLAADLCCGMGYTARAAVAAGMDFVGNEFNSKRLQKTLDFLRAA